MKKLFFLILLLYCRIATADLTLSSEGENMLSDHWEKLVYNSSYMLLDEVINASDEQWQSLRNHPTLGLVQGDLWLRMRIQNPSREERWMLMFNNRGINYVDGWLLSDNETQRFSLGSSLPYYEGRDVDIPPLNQRLIIKQDAEALLILRIRHEGFIDINGSLTSFDVSFRKLHNQYVLELVFYGVYLTLLVYHIILYSVTRDNAYLSYSCFIFATMVFFMFSEAYVWWLLPNHPVLGYSLGHGSLFIIAMFTLRFSHDYLQLYKYPALAWTLRIFRWLLLVLFIGRMWSTAMPGLSLAIQLIALVYVLVPLISIYVYLREKTTIALAFLVTWGIWSLMAVWIVLSIYGVGNTEISSMWSKFKVAFAIQGMFLAWSLGYRIRYLNNQRVSALAESQAKSELIARVSHEIRTPMNGIIGTSQLLDPYLKEPEAVRLKEIIYHSGMSLLTVINDLLDLSRLQNGGITIHPERTNIRKLIEQTMLTLQAQIDQKGLAYRIVIDDTVPTDLQIDAARIRQILFNLIGNAIKFTAKGTIEITGKYDGTLLTLSVIDSGRGIPPEKLHSIFNPYEQVQDSAEERRLGAGLGLHITRNLVDLMAGRIDIESDVGKGTRIALSIPAAISPEKLPSEHQSSNAKNSASLHCLVADDNAVNRKVIEGLLKQTGHTAMLFDDGSEVVRHYYEHANSFDVILLDCEMPIMDGYEAARRIREIEVAKHLPPIPILAITAHAVEGHLDKVLKSGMDGQLSKPITKDILAQALADL